MGSISLIRYDEAMQSELLPSVVSQSVEKNGPFFVALGAVAFIVLGGIVYVVTTKKRGEREGKEEEGRGKKEEERGKEEEGKVQGNLVGGEEEVQKVEETKKIWEIAPEHQFTRYYEGDMKSLSVTKIAFEDKNEYLLHTHASVKEMIDFFFGLLERSEGIAENRALDLNVMIAEREHLSSIIPLPNSTNAFQPSFMMQTVCAVQLRSHRAVEILWTCHPGTIAVASESTSSFSSSSSSSSIETVTEGGQVEGEKVEKSVQNYIDLYVTAADKPSYGPKFGKLVARLIYT